MVAVCSCRRRIVGGVYTAFDKRYMVYFVKSNHTKAKVPGSNLGDNWLCGGAIVSPTQILTAAACLMENNNIYAIAGYRKYVQTSDLDTDECTKRWKQRVVKICVPKDYVFDYSKPIQWLSMDVGVAIVEKPYDFTDLTYRFHCSYVPNSIKVLYEEVYQAEGIDVQMLGWGHTQQRQPHNIQDLNSIYLREASGMIQPKSYCRDNFYDTIMNELIDKYLICVHNSGNLGGNGELLNIGDTNNAECSRRNMDPIDRKCVNDSSLYDDYYFDLRRSVDNSAGVDAISKVTHEHLMNTRRQGICQNDHGGPLITWVGKEEVLIGIALTSLLSDTYECIGPYIFTSVYCASMIIQCLLATDEALRTGCEDKTKEKGYTIEEKTIEWKDSNSERKPAASVFEERHVESLHKQNPVKVSSESYQPLSNQHHQSLHIQPNSQLIVNSETQPQLHPQSNNFVYSHLYQSLNQQSNIKTQPSTPSRPQPIFKLSQPFLNFSPRPKIQDQQPASSSPQLNNIHSEPYLPLILGPKVQAQPRPHSLFKISQPFLNLNHQPLVQQQPPLQTKTNLNSKPPLHPQPKIIFQPHAPLLQPDDGPSKLIDKVIVNNYAKIKNVGF